MKSLVILVTIFAGALAHSDIRRPQPRPNYQVQLIDKEESAEMYEHMKVQPMRGDSLRTYISMVKVQRQNRGLVQKICIKGVSSFRRETTYSCEIWTSIDGRPVPEYVIRRRMG